MSNMNALKIYHNQHKDDDFHTYSNQSINQSVN